MKFLSLTCRDRGDGLELAVTYEYRGKEPDKRTRKKMAKEALELALKTLENNEQVDVGFAEDSQARIRRDHYVVERKT